MYHHLPYGAVSCGCLILVQASSKDLKDQEILQRHIDIVKIKKSSDVSIHGRRSRGQYCQLY